MYHMVHSRMTTSQARERLLAAAVEQAMRGGIADMSLRELAAAIGTSHRMLLYHFGSREGLLTAVARAVEEAQLAAVSEQGITSANARRLWQHFSDPQLWPAERLFFELYATRCSAARAPKDSSRTRSNPGSPRSHPPSPRKPGWTAGPPGQKPGSPSPSPAGCCSTCSPPATATPSPKPSDATSTRRPVRPYRRPVRPGPPAAALTAASERPRPCPAGAGDADGMAGHLLSPAKGEPRRGGFGLNCRRVVCFCGFGKGSPEDQGEVAPCVCPNCHNQVFLHHVRSKKSVSLYFVPVVPYGDGQLPGLSRVQPVAFKLSDVQLRHVRSMSSVTAFSSALAGFPRPSTWRKPSGSGVRSG